MEGKNYSDFVYKPTISILKQCHKHDKLQWLCGHLASKCWSQSLISWKNMVSRICQVAEDQTSDFIQL